MSKGSRVHASRIALLITITLATGVSPKPAQASASENEVESQLPQSSTPTESFSGQIEYSFDSSLNMTHVRLSAPLDTRGVLGRIFFAPPVVDTLIASYEFAGRSISHVPDAIHLTLISDEYVDSVAAEESLLAAPDHGLDLVVGARVRRYGITVAEGLRATTIPGAGPRNLGDERNGRFVMQVPERRQVHISRSLTSLLSICEFLDLISQNEVKGRVAGLDVTISRGVLVGLRQLALEMRPTGPLSAGGGEETVLC